MKKHNIYESVENGKLNSYSEQVQNEFGNWVDLYPAYCENVAFKEKRKRKSKKEFQIIDWSLPGKDYESAKVKNCGKIVKISLENGTISPIITACLHDHDHNPKAKKQSCYQLSCPRCWNDAALRRAKAAEAKILAHKTLSLKRERTHEEKEADVHNLSLGHWVVSFNVKENPKIIGQCPHQNRDG